MKRWRAPLLLCCAMALAACGGSAAPATPGPRAADAPWVAAWTASPTDSTPLYPLLPGQVFRQFLAPHASGERMRLTLSNRLGSDEIRLTRVTAGLQQEGAALVEGSVRRLTFGGSEAVTIPAGQSVQSDPLDFPVRPFAKIGISFSVAVPIMQIPRHYQSLEVPYLGLSADPEQASGNGFVAQSLPLMLQLSPWLLISGLEVQGGSARHTVVALGDSITDGAISKLGNPSLAEPSSIGSEQRYPDHLQRRLLAAGRHEISVANAGISGNRINAGPLSSEHGPQLSERLDSDVLALPNVRSVILVGGMNDLGLQLVPDATPLIEGLDAVVRRLQGQGLRVILGTMSPGRGFVAGPLSMPGSGLEPGLLTGTAEVDAARREVNDWIREHSSADAVVDFDACLRDPARPSYLNPEYDSGDHLHPNSAGYEAMANCIALDSL